jgi:hypothetical protein
MSKREETPMVDNERQERSPIEFEGPQCFWPRPCDMEAKKHLRLAHISMVLDSDWTPDKILIEAGAAAACGFICPDACWLFQEAARRRGVEKVCHCASISEAKK